MREQVIKIFENRVLFLTFLLIILFSVFALLVPGFIRYYNISNMTQYGVGIGLLALAETLVILSGGGGIDISVGSMMSFSAIFIGVLIGRHDISPLFVIPLGLVVGSAMGCINGILITYTKIPALIVTLSTLNIYKSAALVLAVDPAFGPNPMPVSNFPENFGIIGQSKIAGIPLQVLIIFIPAVLIVGFFVNKTSFGRKLYGIGSNETAAKFSGIKVDKLRIFVYTISGFLSALSGWLVTSRIASARPDIGANLELQAITIAVLGGISIKGGKGRILGTVLSIIIITVLDNGLQLAGIPSIWQEGFLGILLVGSVALNNIKISSFQKEG